MTEKNVLPEDLNWLDLMIKVNLSQSKKKKKPIRNIASIYNIYVSNCNRNMSVHV